MTGWREVLSREAERWLAGRNIKKKKNQEVCFFNLQNLGWLLDTDQEKGSIISTGNFVALHMLSENFQTECCRWHRRATDGVAGPWASVPAVCSCSSRSSLQGERCVLGRDKVNLRCSTSSFAVLKCDASWCEFCPSSPVLSSPLFLMGFDVQRDGYQV